jgi:hypothetical protein
MTVALLVRAALILPRASVEYLPNIMNVVISVAPICFFCVQLPGMSSPICCPAARRAWPRAGLLSITISSAAQL